MSEERKAQLIQRISVLKSTVAESEKELSQIENQNTEPVTAVKVYLYPEIWVCICEQGRPMNNLCCSVHNPDSEFSGNSETSIKIKNDYLTETGYWAKSNPEPVVANVEFDDTGRAEVEYEPADEYGDKYEIHSGQGAVIGNLFEFVKAAGDKGRSFTEMNMFYLGKTKETYKPVYHRGGSFIHHHQSMRLNRKRLYSGKVEYIVRTGDGKWITQA